MLDKACTLPGWGWDNAGRLAQRATLQLNIPAADRYMGLVGPIFMTCVEPPAG